MAQSLQISLASPSTRGRLFVHLTQYIENGMDKTASVFDISQMVARAESGQSAHSYKKNECPAGVTDEGDVNVSLSFEVWPSSPTLAYTLSSNIGDISPAVIIEEYTEFSLIFGNVSSVELGFMLRDVTLLSWETACYNSKGEEIYNPKLEMDGLTTLKTDKALFGVARIRGRKIGARHVLTHKLMKSYPVRPDNPIPEEGITSEDLEEYWGYTDVATWNGNPVNEDDTLDLTGLSIDKLDVVIEARWVDVNGDDATESLRLTPPQCLKDLLSTCGEESFSSGTHICDLSDNPKQLTVYVSSCNGKVIEERTTKEDPNSWCE